MKLLTLSLLLGWFLASSAWANSRPYLGDGGLLVELGTALHFTDSKADAVAGADYSKKYTHLQVGVGGFSVLLWERVVVGLQYTYWLAEQQYAVSGNTVQDSLVLHEVGARLGYQLGNPRIRYRLIAGMGYPFGLKVVQKSSSSKDFLPDSVPWVFDGRLQIFLKLNTTLSLLVEGGYRWANLGTFKSDGVEYLPSTGQFDLSGPFIGTGIGIHF
ncbi:hypothetical protein EBT16_02695 [bacterium]|nr:hypothetical protein [bacterium]